MLRDEGKPTEAEPLVREALAIRRKLFGSEHPAVAGSLNTLAGLLETQRKLSDAETASRQALAIRRRRFGNGHPDVASSLATLGHLLCDENQPAEAEPLLRECLDVRQKKLPDDWLTFNTQSLLGGSLFAQKNMLKPNLCYSPATKA